MGSTPQVVIRWIGGPFDGRQELWLRPETGLAPRQALAVSDGSGKITSIAWYRLETSEGAWEYLFEYTESQEEFRTSAGKVPERILTAAETSRRSRGEREAGGGRPSRRNKPEVREG